MANSSTLRRSAVDKAWENEQALVEQGLGTRDWTSMQQQELLDTGRVKGFEGHHMRSVSKYPQHAGDPYNIQFLERTADNNEHKAAHNGDFHEPANGMYVPETGETISFDEFGEDEVVSVAPEKLSNPISVEKDEFEEIGSALGGAENASAPPSTTISESAIDISGEGIGDIDNVMDFDYGMFI